MSHHITGHIPKQQQQVLGALILGRLVAATGNAAGGAASDDAIRQAMLNIAPVSITVNVRGTRC